MLPRRRTCLQKLFCPQENLWFCIDQISVAVYFGEFRLGVAMRSGEPMRDHLVSPVYLLPPVAIAKGLFSPAGALSFFSLRLLEFLYLRTLRYLDILDNVFSKRVLARWLVEPESLAVDSGGRS